MYSNFKSKDGTQWEYTHSPIRPDMDQSGQHTNGPCPLWMKPADDTEWKMVCRHQLRHFGLHWMELVLDQCWSDTELGEFLV